MTAPADEPDSWAAARLRALRVKKKLSQEVLADRADLARTTVNHLEKGRRAMTAHYAERLAPHLGVTARELLPPEEDAADPMDPLVLLRRLGATVERQQATIDELAAKVEVLERAGASRRRGGTGGQ